MRVRPIRSCASVRSSGGSATRLVVDHLDTDAAMAEDDHRAEGRVIGNAGKQLARLGADDHRLDRHAGDMGVRPLRTPRWR